mmetsp:Transcript_116257/g.335823  ORF Transcript_116257/g.335823 Transcript_116257/m.335823 type:complete len:213 (-) Transcript_116257:934-1572(-)
MRRHGRHGRRWWRHGRPLCHGQLCAGRWVWSCHAVCRARGRPGDGHRWRRRLHGRRRLLRRGVRDRRAGLHGRRLRRDHGALADDLGRGGRGGLRHHDDVHLRRSGRGELVHDRPPAARHGAALLRGVGAARAGERHRRVCDGPGRYVDHHRDRGAPSSCTDDLGADCGPASVGHRGAGDNHPAAALRRVLFLGRPAHRLLRRSSPQLLRRR